MDNLEMRKHHYVPTKLEDGTVVYMCDCGAILKNATYATYEMGMPIEINTITSRAEFVRNDELVYGTYQPSPEQLALENDVIASIEEEMSYMGRSR